VTARGDAGVDHEVIICTRDRPEDLRRALDSVANQTLLPDRVLVVDSSEDDRSEKETRRQAAEHSGVEFQHIRSAPGLTRQRNCGVAASRGQVIHFLDDDVVCEPGYLAAIMACFAADPNGEVLGVGGLVTNVRPARPSRWKNLFGLSAADQGRVLASGRPTIVFETDRQLDVDWLSGCCMSYRAIVFSSEKFDETLPGYGLGEDVDFSYRVRQKGRLVVTPEARLEHHQSERNRLQVEEYTYDDVVLRARRVRTGVGTFSMGAFWASVIAQAVALFVDGYALRAAESRRRLAATLRGARAARKARAPRE
jgi:GT2 family glycosyltransferase